MLPYTLMLQPDSMALRCASLHVANDMWLRQPACAHAKARACCNCRYPEAHMASAHDSRKAAKA